MEIVSTLEKIVGPDRVSTSDNVCLSYSFNIGYTRDIERKDWQRGSKLPALW